jgi:hypothetical protein
MAEETLVKEVLTDQMIAAGSALTRQLDRSNWSVAASLWLYEPEINEWRLLIASPSVSSEGPLAAYRLVSAALQEITPRLSLDSISVVPPEDARVRALASAYQTGTDIQGRRVFRSAINGYYIDDAYVYRLLPIAPAA